MYTSLLVTGRGVPERPLRLAWWTRRTTSRTHRGVLRQGPGPGSRCTANSTPRVSDGAAASMSSTCTRPRPVPVRAARSTPSSEARRRAAATTGLGPAADGAAAPSSAGPSRRRPWPQRGGQHPLGALRTSWSRSRRSSSCSCGGDTQHAAFLPRRRWPAGPPRTCYPGRYAALTSSGPIHNFKSYLSNEFRSR